MKNYIQKMKKKHRLTANTQTTFTSLDDIDNVLTDNVNPSMVEQEYNEINKNNIFEQQSL